MRVALATEAAPGRPNEDFATASANAAVLLDGAGTPAGSESGCSHGVTWYARTLGASLLAAMTQRHETLFELLAAEIKAVAGLHEDTCDLAHPGSPSATVVMLRRTDDALEWLVLADSSLVLDTGDTADPMVICDDREAQVGARYRKAMDALDSGTPEHQQAEHKYVETLRAHRNRDGGFWVAATDPLAADQALTGTVPRESVGTAVLLSDGATRLVDRFHLATWRQTLDLLDREGPEALVTLSLSRSPVPAAVPRPAPGPMPGRWTGGGPEMRRRAAQVRPQPWPLTTRQDLRQRETSVPPVPSNELTQEPNRTAPRIVTGPPGRGAGVST